MGILHCCLICLVLSQVSEVLKRHNIKPHWMFAFDDLVRSAVHAAMNILQPGETFIHIIAYIN